MVADIFTYIRTSLTKQRAAPGQHQGRRNRPDQRVTDDRVKVLIPFLQPTALVDWTPHVSSRQKIELSREVTRVDEDMVMVAARILG